MGATNNIECKMTFEVPDGYFDTLGDNIMQRIDFEERQRKGRRAKLIRAGYLMAAVMAGVAIIMSAIWRQDNALPNNAEQVFSQQYLTALSRQYNDDTVIDIIQQNNEEQADDETDAANTEYDIELISMYASPVNFTY